MILMRIAQEECYSNTLAQEGCRRRSGLKWRQSNLRRAAIGLAWYSFLWPAVLVQSRVPRRSVEGGSVRRCPGRLAAVDGRPGLFCYEACLGGFC